MARPKYLSAQVLTFSELKATLLVLQNSCECHLFEQPIKCEFEEEGLRSLPGFSKTNVEIGFASVDGFLGSETEDLQTLTTIVSEGVKRIGSSGYFSSGVAFHHVKGGTKQGSLRVAVRSGVPELQFTAPQTSDPSQAETRSDIERLFESLKLPIEVLPSQLGYSFRASAPADLRTNENTVAGGNCPTSFTYIVRDQTALSLWHRVAGALKPLSIDPVEFSWTAMTWPLNCSSALATQMYTEIENSGWPARSYDVAIRYHLTTLEQLNALELLPTPSKQTKIKLGRCSRNDGTLDMSVTILARKKGFRLEIL